MRPIKISQDTVTVSFEAPSNMKLSSGGILTVHLARIGGSRNDSITYPASIVNGNVIFEVDDSTLDVRSGRYLATALGGTCCAVAHVDIVGCDKLSFNRS
jgi:hypothetical protein